jgi:hypothetical protein
MQVLLKLIQPYTRVRLPFISHALHIPEADVERLLVSLILDNRIEGYVDQVCVGGGLCSSTAHMATGPLHQLLYVGVKWLPQGTSALDTSCLLNKAALAACW